MNARGRDHFSVNAATLAEERERESETETKRKGEEESGDYKYLKTRNEI